MLTCVFNKVRSCSHNIFLPYFCDLQNIVWFLNTFIKWQSIEYQRDIKLCWRYLLTVSYLFTSFVKNMCEKFVVNLRSNFIFTHNQLTQLLFLAMGTHSFGGQRRNTEKFFYWRICGLTSQFLGISCMVWLDLHTFFSLPIISNS